jgi:D-lactate dehydrogenase (cytochrome)
MDAHLDTCFEELAQLLGGRFARDEHLRRQHAGDESSHEPSAPDAVALPESTQEVSHIVKVCAKHRVPIVPYGRGTAVEGGVVATHGGVCLDVARMNRILEINLDDMDATVQAGVTQFALNRRLADSAYFFSVDPGAEATLGGMAATRASGTNAVRYGTMRENVLGLTAVLADGRIIRTSSRARKSAAGYDLTRLFVGSEGTLGVITQLVVRLHCRPQALSAAVCAFEDIESAVETAMATIQAGIPVARVELLDEVSMDAICRYANLDYAAAPTLFFEFQGTAHGVVEQAQRVGVLAERHGGSAFRWAADDAGREQLWQARHDAYYALVALRPGARSLTTDVCVPISRLAECIRQTKLDLAACRVPAYLLGHVGDGNFHVLFLMDPHDPAEFAEAQRLNQRIVERALEMQGTCTGEHGIGLGKIGFLESEFGESMCVMRAIKRALDPHNLMNPGKVLRV